MGSGRLLDFRSTGEFKFLSFVCLNENGEDDANGDEIGGENGSENGIRDDESSADDDGLAVDDA